MKKTALIIAIFTIALFNVIGQNIVSPSIKSKTSFAIIVDSESYEKARTEIDAYRKVIEADGLGTYVISNNWKNPEEIRNQLIELYRNKNRP